jgi:hypothetical protein
MNEVEGSASYRMDWVGWYTSSPFETRHQGIPIHIDNDIGQHNKKGNNELI